MVVSTTDPPAADNGISGGQLEEEEEESLIIPITSASGSSSSSDKDNLFIEIFPDELGETPVSVLLKVLRQENTPIDIYADAAVLYMREKKRRNGAREALTLLEAACEETKGTTTTTGGSSTTAGGGHKNVRVLAATGIAHLALQGGSDGGTSGAATTVGATSSTGKQQHGGGGGTTAAEEIRNKADQKFTLAAGMDTFFPMTWMGRGMLHLSANRNDQAKFFFQTTLKECGQVLPAILGMALIHFREGKVSLAQNMYAQAIRQYPKASGASARVGFATCCYHLGQVDRAKAAFQRALAMDPEDVPAMVGSAVLDLAAASSASNSAEQAIKLMSMANLIDHNNAMVQNHLSNHYFWKWTPVTGSVSVSTGSTIMTSRQPMPLEAGEPVRVGSKFETTVVEVLEDDEDDDGASDGLTTRYRLGDAWKDPEAAGLKVWKKDYERVFALAKGAYSSTTVPEIQAESLFFLARVYHAREDTDNAQKFYDRACKLAPKLTPARFGLAQTLIVQEKYDEAASQLKQLLSQTSNATDAFALLGLLQVRKGLDEEGLVNLRKAIELDPANPDLVLLEALALQQHKSHYTKSLEKYKKAIDLMKRRNTPIPHDIYTNVGVLCHETRRQDEALDMYKLALQALIANNSASAQVSLDNTGIGGVRIVNPDNDMFFGFVDSGIQAMVDKQALNIKDVIEPGSLPFSVGEQIQVAGSFVSDVVKVEAVDGGVLVELKETYDPMNENDSDESPLVSIAVKRENRLLDLDEATTVAFNIARLHEASGKTLAAIELHKAIVKRNPAYVNSYLRLACVAVDCGSLNECAQWLKIAAAAAPGNSEVLTLIGNLHLSLCDWKPAQKVFDGLMAQKVTSVEAYSGLSMGNIYFANLNVSEERYAKHLQYASDYYKRILSKDPLNAYAANGIGTVLAEKAEIFKAKEVFHRVREVSGDSIADALLNLGHIYLAQKKHPEALQLYKSYMKRAEDGTTPITSRSRTDDIVDVLLYIAFAYFDWARHTELFNDANAAPADGRYKQAMEHLELAISKQSKKAVVLKYNLCMTKLQAANCVLQKLTRNIPRTVEEVEEALSGLEESLKIVEQILKDKEENGQRINIRTSTLEDFLKHCRANIASAQSHLEDERKRALEEKDEQEIRRLAAEAAQKEAALREAIKKQEEAKKQEERDQRAEANMRKVEDLRSGWQQEQELAKASKDKKSKNQPPEPPELEELDDAPATHTHGLFDDSDEESDAGAQPAASDKPDETSDKPAPSQGDIFGDSDDSEEDKGEEKEDVTKKPESKKKESSTGLFGDSDSDSDEDADFEDSGAKNEGDSKPAATSKDLFGDDSDEESDEELVPAGSKRSHDESKGEDDGKPSKKPRVVDDGDE